MLIAGRHVCRMSGAVHHRCLNESQSIACRLARRPCVFPGKGLKLMPFPLLHSAALIGHSPSSLTPTRNAVSVPICCDCGQPFSAPSAFGDDGFAQGLLACGPGGGEGLGCLPLLAQPPLLGCSPYGCCGVAFSRFSGEIIPESTFSGINISSGPSYSGHKWPGDLSACSLSFRNARLERVDERLVSSPDIQVPLSANRSPFLTLHTFMDNMSS